MLRLPLASRDDLIEELAEIERQLEHCAWVEPVSGHAGARLEERKVGLIRWRDALQAQLAEMPELPSCS